MGQAIKDDTKNILITYLALGLLEENKLLGNPKFLTQNEIRKKIEIKNEIENEIINKITIGRRLKDFEEWLKPLGLTYEDRNSLIIRGNNEGFKLSGNIPQAAYKDYVANLLFLTLIDDKRHTEHLGKMTVREGALALITNLVIARRKKVYVNLKLNNRVREVTIIPDHFNYTRNKWWIIGKDKNHKAKIYQLLEIKSAKLLCEISS